MQSPLEIRHLRAVLALAEMGSMSRAAEHLCITHSALSQQFKQLEAQYGVSLFERKSQPLRLTPSGERLMNLAREVVRRIDDAERDIARIAGGSAGTLRIALECHSCFDWLMPALDRLLNEWPEVEQDLVSGLTPDPVTLVLNNEADLAVHSEPENRDGVTYHSLFDFEMVGCCSPRHMLAGRPYLKPEDFAAETLIHYPVDDRQLDGIREFLKPAGVDPDRRTAELTVAIIQLVASGRGLAMLPTWTIQPQVEQGYIRSLPLGKNGLWCRLYAASLPDAPPWIDHFLQLIRELAPTTLSGIKRC